MDILIKDLELARRDRLQAHKESEQARKKFEESDKGVQQLKGKILRLQAVNQKKQDADTFNTVVCNISETGEMFIGDRKVSSIADFSPRGYVCGIVPSTGTVQNKKNVWHITHPSGWAQNGTTVDKFIGVESTGQVFIYYREHPTVCTTSIREETKQFFDDHVIGSIMFDNGGDNPTFRPGNPFASE
tara:strand:+ start:3072 stop:3632 length:561 start_codon:yes stop_codon:yes gene_type:complete